MITKKSAILVALTLLAVAATTSTGWCQSPQDLPPGPCSPLNTEMLLMLQHLEALLKAMMNLAGQIG